MWPLFRGIRAPRDRSWRRLAHAATGSITLVFAVLGVALPVYGAIVGIATWSGCGSEIVSCGFAGVRRDVYA
jgi:hypothetical protein